VPLAKKLAGTVSTKLLEAPQDGAGMVLDVVKAKTADGASPATRFAKGIVIETAVMVPAATPTIPVAEQVRV